MAYFFAVQKKIYDFIFANIYFFDVLSFIISFVFNA